MKNVLVVAAHPDDEVLGCGGSIKKFWQMRNNVHVLFMSRGRAGEVCATKSAEFLRFLPMFGQLEDQRFDTYPLTKLISTVEEAVDMVKPNLVYTHWLGDINRDHQLTAQAVLTACRPLKNSVWAVRAFEIPGSTEFGREKPFVPNFYESITGDAATAKLAAMEQCYKGELREMPHPRSTHAITAKAHVRGSECGEMFAEAFHTYWER